MVVYDQTAIENSTSLLPVLQTVNTWSNGLLGIVLLGVVSVVMFASTRNQDTRVSFVVISFITMLSSALLYLLEMVKQEAVGFCIALFVGALMHFFLTTD